MYTKGPWGFYNNGRELIVDHNNVDIAKVLWQVRDGQGEENARLISACPEMLEALKGVVRAFEWAKEDHLDPAGLIPYQKIIEAINKAEGRR